MSHTHIDTAVLLLLCLPACVLPGADDGGASASTTATPTTETSSAPSTQGSSDSGDDTGMGETSSDDTGTADDTGTTGALPPTDCTQASLYLGSPYFNGDLEGQNPAGQGRLDEPPLRSRHLADLDGHLMVETQFELWGVDGDVVRRVAGDELEPQEQYQPAGACADVRFIVAAGIAALPGNRLVVADIRGNGLVELSDPMGACTAAPVAGNPDQTFDVDVQDGAAAHGDVDGPGAQARFFGVSRPTADGDGNVYVIDSGNLAIKRVADDAERTVTTLHRFGDDAVPMGMTVLDGTLYVTGSDPTNDFVWAIDADTGTQTVLFEGRGLFDEIPDTQQASLFSATNDGVDLLVASNKGYILRMSTNAEPLGAVAGLGMVVDFPGELDLSMPIPTAGLPLRSYAINDGSLVRSGDDLMFAGAAGGVGFHVWAIACE